MHSLKSIIYPSPQEPKIRVKQTQSKRKGRNNKNMSKISDIENRKIIEKFKEM